MLLVDTFGERLKRLRTEAGLSAASLAGMIGVTEGAIRQLENGRSTSASFENGVLLAEALNVTPRYLALGDRAKSKTPGTVPVTRAEFEALKVAVEDVLARQVEGLQGKLVIPATPTPPERHKAPERRRKG